MYGYKFRVIIVLYNTGFDPLFVLKSKRDKYFICNLLFFFASRVQVHLESGYEPSRVKTNNVISKQVQHKSGCAHIEAGSREA